MRLRNSIYFLRWVKAPNYTALMTGSWDKTLKFWDLRSPNPVSDAFSL